MADLATLGVVVKSTGVAKAEADLKGLSREGAKAEKQADSLGRAWGKKLGAAVLVGTGIAVLAIRRIVQNTIEADKVQAQLAARIKSTGGVAGLTVKGLNDMADGLQRLTAFDDEAIGGVQSLLLTFTKIGKDVFPDATKAVLDMSTALGTDLNSAALQVGKALNDPVKGITALSRAGVQFSEAQKDTIKQLVETGRVAQAQTLILAELEGQMGGSAEAARNTLGGALTALGNSFDNLLEGDTSGGIKGTVQAINDLNTTLNSPEVKQGFATMIEGLAGVANGAAQTIALLGTFKKAISDSFKDSGDLDRDGLIAREIELQDRIKAAESKGPAVSGFVPRRRENVEALKTELAEVQRLEASITRGVNGAAIAAQQGGSSGSPNGRGRGVRSFSADPVAASTPKPRAASAGRARLSDSIEDSARELAELNELQAEQEDRWEALTAQLNGPLAQAEYDHSQRLAEISKAGKDAGASSDEIAQALAKETQAYTLQTEAIKAQLDPTAQLLSDIAFETELMGLNGAEREKAIALRYANIDAATREGQAISAAIDAQEQKFKDLEGIEFARDATKGVFEDLIDGVGSAEDAVDNFFDNLRAKALQILADKIFDGLFDGLAADSGKGAGGLGGFLSSLFGGARAIGGPVSGNRLYEVGEKDAPELLDIRGKQFLIPGASGRVTPVAESSGGGGGVVNQVINVTGTVSKYTASQMQREAHRRQQMAGAR